MEAALERLEQEAESTEKQMETEARRRAGDIRRGFDKLTSRIQALQEALREEDNIMLARATRRAAAAWEEAKVAIDTAAVEEAWTLETRARRKDEVRGPVENLLGRARERQRAAAFADWIRQSEEVITEAKGRAEDVVREQEEDYTEEEVEHLLRKFEEWARQLDQLIAAGT